MTIAPMKTMKYTLQFNTKKVEESLGCFRGFCSDVEQFSCSYMSTLLQMHSSLSFRSSFLVLKTKGWVSEIRIALDFLSKPDVCKSPPSVCAFSSDWN